MDSAQYEQPPFPRKVIQNLPDVIHGALDFAELEQHGLQVDAVLDFSTNTNPYGPTPKVYEALRSTSVDRYPDREALELRRKLAAGLGVEIDQIIAGNGSAELMWLAALAFLDPGDRVLILAPTFGEYAHAAGIAGARIEEIVRREENRFVIDPQSIQARLAGQDFRMVFACRPNNPSGDLLPFDCLAGWSKAFPQTLFVLDEAYLAFAPNTPSAIDLKAPNFLVLRSMTKDYALTGLRLGYAIGERQVIAALRKVRPPWNVNVMALSAGAAALDDPQHLQTSIGRLLEEKDRLAAALAERGFTVLPSSVHFFMIKVGDGARFRLALRAKGILVRDCASFGLPEYVRIAARKPEENARLLAAIDEVRQ